MRTFIALAHAKESPCLFAQIASPEHSATPLLGSISAEGMQHLLDASATLAAAGATLGTLVITTMITVILTGTLGIFVMY